MPKTRNDALLKPAQPRSDLVNPHEWCREPSRSAVYFIRYKDFIKIGWSSNLPKRLREHFKEAERHGVTPTVVAAVYGTRHDEHIVHRYFADCNIRSEDFSPSKPLTDYIRWLRSQYFVGCGDDPYENAAITNDGIVLSVEKVDFEGWKPTPERVLPYEPNLFTSADEFEPRQITGDDYYTPSDIIDRVRTAMRGRITLDPASHPAANGVVKAERLYVKADNGLIRPWAGRVWLNPPFSEWSLFAAKAMKELDRGEIEIMMLLISMTAITTQYIRPLLNRADFLIIPCGRMKFWGPLAGESPTGHSLLAFLHDASYREPLLEAFPADLFARYPRAIADSPGRAA